MWSSSRVKYSQLPTSDHGIAIDYRSPFNFDSAFKYSGGRKGRTPALTEQREYNPPFIVHLCTCMVIFLSFLVMILTFPISGFLCIKVIKQHERVVIFRLGRLQPLKGPGVVLILPCIDKCRRVDLRMRAFNVPPQKIFTVDGAVISCGANIHFQINDVIMSVTSVQDLNHATRALAQTALTNLLTTKRYSDIAVEKHSINDFMHVELNVTTQEWGVAVTRVEVSEITLLKEANPFQMGPVVMPPFQGLPFDMLKSQKSGFSSVQIPPSMSSVPNVQVPSLAAIPEQTSEPATTMSAEDILSAVKLLLNDSLVENIGAVYKFIISGNNTETYYLDLKNGSGDAGTGEPPSGEPDVVLEMSNSDMQKIFAGELRPFQAFMSGRLIVSGDRGVAMKLDQVVKRLQSQDS
ncbi:stomatin-like protein 1 [Glandiceps talaboti]